MAHYARINADNIVTYVTPIPNEMIVDENGTEHEEWALNHLYSTIVKCFMKKTIKIIYETSFQ